jgi:hypothetical protein
MSKYNAPKKHLHRDFLYLDHETVLNSLSAFEAGRIDEIIEKTGETSDTSGEVGLNLGPAKGGGAKRREAELHEELVRKRTRFSAFEGWHQQLKAEDAIGSFEGWDLAVRNDMRVGDTIEFQTRVRLSPLYLTFRTYAAYAKEASPTSALFKVTRQEQASAQSTARMMAEWTKGPGGGQSSSVYFEPVGASDGSPRIVGRVDESYVMRGLGELDGEVTAIGQVEALLAKGDELSAIRVVRDTPATPLETRVIAEAMANFKGEAGDAMGVLIDDEDITFRYPVVILRPIAIYR